MPYTVYTDIFASCKVCELSIADTLQAEIFANSRFLVAHFFTNHEKYFGSIIYPLSPHSTAPIDFFSFEHNFFHIRKTVPTTIFKNQGLFGKGLKLETMKVLSLKAVKK